MGRAVGAMLRGTSLDGMGSTAVATVVDGLDVDGLGMATTGDVVDGLGVARTGDFGLDVDGLDMDGRDVAVGDDDGVNAGWAGHQRRARSQRDLTRPAGRRLFDDSIRSRMRARAGACRVARRRGDHWMAPTERLVARRWRSYRAHRVTISERHSDRRVPRRDARLTTTAHDGLGQRRHRPVAA